MRRDHSWVGVEMVAPIHYGIVLVFFIYGLAFFCMGLLMVLEARRSPTLATSRSLWALGAFGIIHGSHEWLEMAIGVAQWFQIPFPAWLPGMRIVLLVASFSSLIVFALIVFQAQESTSSRRYRVLGTGLFAGYILLSILFISRAGLSAQLRIDYADALARYILAVSGAALAGIALERQARLAQRGGERNLAVSLRLAAFGFGIYSLTQVFVPPLAIFPAKYLNTQTFQEATGIPIQAVRASMAVLVAAGLSRAAHIVESERQRRLEQAQQARLEALEQVQRELSEREALRRELLRHIVVAQEDERARIARELHDETAQFLTALSLNLATLRSSLDASHPSTAILERLQSLSSEMARGVYRLVHDLRPAQLDDLGLAAALAYLADEVGRRSGLEIYRQIEADTRRLDALVETVLFRVAQEALSNVVRHAHARHVWLRLTFLNQHVRLQVQDDGVGFDPCRLATPPEGLGLAGMRERAEAVGGQLSIVSTPGQGTLVEVTIPLSPGRNSQVRGEAP